MSEPGASSAQHPLHSNAEEASGAAAIAQQAASSSEPASNAPVGSDSAQSCWLPSSPPLLQGSKDMQEAASTAAMAESSMSPTREVSAMAQPTTSGDEAAHVAIDMCANDARPPSLADASAAYVALSTSTHALHAGLPRPGSRGSSSGSGRSAQSNAMTQHRPASSAQQDNSPASNDEGCSDFSVAHEDSNSNAQAAGNTTDRLSCFLGVPGKLVQWITGSFKDSIKDAKRRLDDVTHVVVGKADADTPSMPKRRHQVSATVFAPGANMHKKLLQCKHQHV